MRHRVRCGHRVPAKQIGRPEEQGKEWPIKITIIGWWGAYPGPAEATSGYLLQSGGLNILIDCGSGVLGQVQKTISLDEIDAVVLSHYHADHVADLHCLQYAARASMDLGIRQAPLSIYGHAEDSFFDNLDYHDYTVGHVIDTKTDLHLGEMTLTFTRNVHPAPCFSMRIQKKNRTIAYISDTQWTDRLVAVAEGADLLICEASLYNAYQGAVPGHLTAGEAGRIAHQAKVGRLVLSHLPHFGHHQDLRDQAAAVYRGPVELARTGSTWQMAPA